MFDWGGSGPLIPPLLHAWIYTTWFRLNLPPDEPTFGEIDAVVVFKFCIFLDFIDVNKF